MVHHGSSTGRTPTGIAPPHPGRPAGRRRRGLRQRSAAVLVPVLAALVAASPLAPAAADDRHRAPEDTVIRAWDLTASQATVAAGLSAPDGHVVLAYVAIAVHDAAVAVHDRYDPVAVDVDARRGASAEAAVSAAAYRVLLHHLPTQASALDSTYTTQLATVPDGRAEDRGVAAGEQVAAALLALRAGDGFRAPVTNPAGPGLWVMTGPPPPAGESLGHMTPFVLESADQFRPDGPPALTSRRWARDFEEVKRVGAQEPNTHRTDAQTLTAQFWAEHPVLQARGSFRRFVEDHDLDLLETARFLAMVSVTYADALIACFDSKYHELFWRPVTAIPAGNTDGNPRTQGDPGWKPLLGTPNHPEYPSAHGCITPAGGLVVAHYLDSRRIDFTVPSISTPSLGDRTFRTPRELTREVADARVWGGIHFRSAVQDGAELAEEVAEYVLDHRFDD